VIVSALPDPVEDQFCMVLPLRSTIAPTGRDCEEDQILLDPGFGFAKDAEMTIWN
jgi:dihydropteroate synthase